MSVSRNRGRLDSSSSRSNIRGAVTPPPRMKPTAFLGEQQQASFNNDLNKSTISDRANIRPSQIATVINRENKAKISEHIQAKRSTSQNHLLPPKEELSVVLKSIRRKVNIYVHYMCRQSLLTLLCYPQARRRKEEKQLRQMRGELVKSA